MIEQVHQKHPEMSIERLCSLMGVSRSWYYERPPATEKAKRDVELRDAIERIVLEFPGSTDTAGSRRHSGVKGGG